MVTSFRVFIWHLSQFTTHSWGMRMSVRFASDTGAHTHSLNTQTNDLGIIMFSSLLQAHKGCASQADI